LAGVTVRTKICCNTHLQDVALSVAEGADAVGVVVEYPTPVPWSLPRSRAAELIRSVPPFVSSVAVVGGDADTILRLAEATAPDVVQLHGDEAQAVVAAVRDGLTGTGIQLVKAVRIPRSATVDDTAGWVRTAQSFVEAGADAILLDAHAPERPGGTGRSFDWSIARAVGRDCSRPVILAGGLTPENVVDAVRIARPYGLDVVSSVEDEEHRKVRERVRAFVTAARRAADLDAGSARPRRD
jgi:phosphoribosylanthranilate isomerase